MHIYKDLLELSDVGIQIVERKRELERKDREAHQEMENLRVLYQTIEEECQYTHKS